MRTEIIGGATLYLADWREVLPTMHGLSAIVTDPPFFTPAAHYQSRISWGRSWADLSVLGEYFFQLAEMAKKALADDGHLLTFCHDESYPVFYPGAYRLWDFTSALVWDKTRVGLGKIFRHQYELILWASNAGAYAATDGVLHCDILKHSPTLSAERDHPVQKPVSLMRELITVCTRIDSTVADLFMGSGTTGEAAVSLRRKFLGVEFEPKYFDIACRRIEQAQRQGDLLNYIPPAQDPADHRMADLFAEPITD
jgi:hypothetical protein